MVRINPNNLRPYPAQRIDYGQEHMARSYRHSRDEQLDNQSAVSEGMASEAVEVACGRALKAPVKDCDQRLQHNRQFEQEDLNRS